MIGLSPTEIARAAGATLVAGAPEPAGAADAPVRAVVDSRQAGPGDLFVGLAGERADGGAFAAAAIEAGAWGAIVTGAHTASASAAAAGAGARVFESDDPLAALGALARRVARPAARATVAGWSASPARPGRRPPRTSCWRSPGRRSAGACTPTARTSTPRSGLPLTVLEAEEGTELIVLEMAMRGHGPDPRAGADRASRRGRDHERRPRAPGAGRDGRARRGGEGGADPRAGARRGVCRAGRRRRRCVRICAPTCGC